VDNQNWFHHEDHEEHEGFALEAMQGLNWPRTHTDSHGRTRIKNSGIDFQPQAKGSRKNNFPFYASQLQATLARSEAVARE
jgi:hypothetical protein